MSYSKLKNEIEVLELKHKHQLAELQMKHRQEINALKITCNHTYDDGSSAKRAEGTQWDNYSQCKICNKIFR
ncbi:hypothetical protein [Bacillus phage vB_BanS-Thrax2]|nr:hypothetical protein [Bacillus phage vB_BanS-Thrax2]